jgi:hypothetical protein
MRKQIVAVTACVSFVAIGCDKSELLSERAQRISASQAQGTTGSTISLMRAYDYNGHSYHETKPGQKLIGVDVLFENPNVGLDLDDVEIVNGANSESLGSFPDIYLLTKDGELADQSAWPTGKPDQLRVLIIYQVPADITSIKLRYWGNNVMNDPVRISGTGPEVDEVSN